MVAIPFSFLLKDYFIFVSNKFLLRQKKKHLLDRKDDFHKLADILSRFNRQITTKPHKKCTTAKIIVPFKLHLFPRFLFDCWTWRLPLMAKKWFRN